MNMQSPKQASVDFVILPEHGLIIERFNEVVNLEMIFAASHAIWSSPVYDIYYKGLIDTRGCRFDVTIVDLIKIANFFFSNRKTTRGFGILLSDTKKGVTNSIIFSSKMSKLMNFHAASSLESALRQLNITHETYDLLNSDLAQTITQESLLQKAS